MPSDPTQSTTITYTANDYTVTTHFVDEAGKQLADDDVLTKQHIGDSYVPVTKVITGYVLTQTTGVPNDGLVPAGDITVTNVYSPVGKVVVTTPNGDTTETPYVNDPVDPGKVTPPEVTVPNVPGYTPVDGDGNVLSPIDPKDPSQGYQVPNVPSDPTKSTEISYTANAYTVTTRFVDKDGKQLANDVVLTDQHIGDRYVPVAKVIMGYVLSETTGVPNDSLVPASDVTVTNIYNPVGKVVVTTPGGDTTETPYVNDPVDPGKATPPEVTVPSVPGYTPVDGDGHELTPVDPSDPSKGYQVPTVPSDPSKSIEITYQSNNYTVTTQFVDIEGNKLAEDVVLTDQHVGDAYTPVAKVIKGYYLVQTIGTPSNDKIPAKNVTVTNVYKVLGNVVVTSPSGNKTTTPYVNDPTDPGKIVTPDVTIPDVESYVPVGPDGHDLTPVDPDDLSKGYQVPVITDPGTNTMITYRQVPIDNNGGDTPSGDTTGSNTTDGNTSTTGNDGSVISEKPEATAIDDNGTKASGKNKQQTQDDSTVTETQYGVSAGKQGGHVQRVDVQADTVQAKTAANQHLTNSGTDRQTLPQTNDDQQGATAFLGVMGMLSAMALATKRRKREDED